MVAIIIVTCDCTRTYVSILKIAVVRATIVCRRCPYIVLGFSINQTTRKISKVLLICHLIIEATPTLCEIIRSIHFYNVWIRKSIKVQTLAILYV